LCFDVIAQSLFGYAGRAASSQRNRLALAFCAELVNPKTPVS
jgi:hypothetical protein